MTNQIITRKQASAQQLPRYFTNKPCVNGHIDERNTKSGKCMECQRIHGKQFRENNPEVMKQWRENNPGYASKKYHENVDIRKIQTKEWYDNNKERALKRHKVWYYAEGMAEKLLASRRAWYEKNPQYDAEYHQRHKERLLQQAAIRRPKLAQAHKAILQQIFQDIAAEYQLPDNPTERDFKYWLAGKIAAQTGWTVNKEVWLDTDRTSRIDLLIPEAKLGLELKLSNRNWRPDHVTEQQLRYQLLLEHDGYEVIVVSLDGSLGMSAEEFLDTLPAL